MHYLIKKTIVVLAISILSLEGLNAENLYSCMMNGTNTTYHENDARRLISMGADCRLMNRVEHITCSMRGVRVSYSREEAKKLLVEYPDANCEINDRLFISQYNGAKQTKSLEIVSRLTIYFSVNGKNLSKKSRDQLKAFSRKHRNMGYTYTITGYASATGTSASNHTLSLKRAGIVRNTLLDGGINSENILSVDALGEESLRYKTKYEERRNRAVEIKAYHR